MTARNFLYVWMPLMAVLLTATSLWLALKVEKAQPPSPAERTTAQEQSSAAVAGLELNNPAEAQDDEGDSGDKASSDDLRFFNIICLIMTLGALGAHVQALISFADYIGNRQFEESWTFFYVKRPFVGATVSLLTFSVLRGGFADVGANSIDTNSIWGTVAIGLMAGLFSRQAMDKIAEIFGVMFSSRKVQRDDSLDVATATTPELQKAAPDVVPRGKETEIIITGVHLPKNVRIHGNGKKLNHKWISDTELQVAIPDHLTRESDVHELQLIATNSKANPPQSKPLAIKIVA